MQSLHLSALDLRLGLMAGVLAVMAAGLPRVDRQLPDAGKPLQHRPADGGGGHRRHGGRAGDRGAPHRPLDRLGRGLRRRVDRLPACTPPGLALGRGLRWRAWWPRSLVGLYQGGLTAYARRAVLRGHAGRADVVSRCRLPRGRRQDAAGHRPRSSCGWAAASTARSASSAAGRWRSRWRCCWCGASCAGAAAPRLATGFRRALVAVDVAVHWRPAGGVLAAFTAAMCAYQLPEQGCARAGHSRCRW